MVVVSYKVGSWLRFGFPAGRLSGHGRLRGELRAMAERRKRTFTLFFWTRVKRERKAVSKDEIKYGASGTIEDVVEQMTERWRVLHRQRDWRAVFAKTYLATTEQLLEAYRKPGTFLNPEWIVRIDCEFAQRYFEAFDAWERGEPCPWPWRIAFRSASSKRTMVFQDMLLGMNAHINYDLPFSLDATIPTGITREELATYRQDNDTLNRILGSIVDVIQDEVGGDYDPGIGLMDTVLDDVDEAGGARMIRLWRERSWGNFLLLRSTRDSPEERELVEKSIERTANDFALILLQLQQALPFIYWPNRVYRDTLNALRRSR